MMNITLKNFERDVIAASAQVPVLLDIWAEWCGPCKTLGPVLEKLETEYAGRFLLAKVNADEEPEIAGQLSQMFGVRSIPFCVLFSGGQPVDGFVGALPADQVRTFLDKHIPTLASQEAIEDVVEAESLAAHGDPVHAQAKLEEALQLDPQNETARLELVKLLLGQQQVQQAEEIFAPLQDKASGPLADKRVTAFALYLEACRKAQQAAPVAELEASLASNKRDFQARLTLAQIWLAQGEFTRAMDELLEILMRDKAWQDEAARKLYVAILEILTKPQPKAAPTPSRGNTADTQSTLQVVGRVAATQGDPVLDQYRRRLSMVLF